MRIAIQAKKIITSQGELQDQVVVINQEKIEQISNCIPNNCDQVLDAGDSILSPGFIDVHIHGRSGSDVMDNTVECIETISRTLVSTGVTGWVGTTVTAPWQMILESIINMANYIESHDQPDSELLGIFMEGPYFTEKHRGSHLAKYLMPPTIKQLKEVITAGKGSLLRVAIAPEINNAENAIRWLVEHKVKVSIAHTNATFNEIKKAHYLGADCGVHLFNGMSGLHHRDPGCVGGILYHDMIAELIADGIHIHPAVIALTYRLKSYKKIMLITDCMRAGGLPDGEYLLGKQKVKVESSQAKTLDGSLAGSTCSLDQALRNLVFKAEIPIWEAIQTVTTIPAHYLQIANRVGNIAVGMQANLTLLDPQLNVKATMIKGKWRFSTLKELSDEF